MAYSISVYLPILLILYTMLQMPLVYGKLTPWCGVIDYALVGRNYTTINATKNQKLCYQACLKDSPRCRSANYRPRDQECDLNCASPFDVCAGGRLVKHSGSLYTFTASEMMGCDLHPDSTNTDVCSVDNFTPSCQEGSEWQLIFKGVAGTGIKLYDLWTNTTWGEDLGCHGNYRNKALYDAWNDRKLNVKQVKLSLHDDTGVKVELVFKGTDSDILSWFAKERLVTSPWSDLTTTATTNYFSIDGDVTPIRMVDRRFFINMNYGGCDKDRGWMVVLDSGVGPCPWEISFSSYPVIMYSTTYTSTNFNDTRNDKTLGIADYLTIHIDTE